MATHDVETDSLARAFIDASSTSFRANKGFADQATAQLPDEKLRIALDPNTNSIAVVMKHVAGNLRSRWTDFLTTDGEKPWRDRDAEFVDAFADRDELSACWESGWRALFDALSALSPADLGPLRLPRRPDRPHRPHPGRRRLEDDHHPPRRIGELQSTRVGSGPRSPGPPRRNVTLDPHGRAVALAGISLRIFCTHVDILVVDSRRTPRE